MLCFVCAQCVCSVVSGGGGGRPEAGQDCDSGEGWARLLHDSLSRGILCRSPQTLAGGCHVIQVFKYV